MTYDARVTVPKWATPVMSALSKETSVQAAEYGDQVYEFTQPVPIPSYLFALAVGDLDSRDISPRCRVWSEPSMVEAGEWYGMVCDLENIIRTSSHVLTSCVPSSNTSGI